MSTNTMETAGPPQTADLPEGAEATEAPQAAEASEAAAAPVPVELPDDEETREILRALAAIVEEVAEVPAATVELDKRFVDDLDIDSLSMIEIAAQTEAAFEMDIAPEALADLLAVRDAVALIRSHRAV